MQTQIQYRKYCILCTGIFDTTSAINWLQSAVRFTLLSNQKDSRLNFLPYEDYTKSHVELMKKNLMPLLTRQPLPGTNKVIIGHDDPFEAVTGIYPEPQGIAYILQPDGEKSFKIIDSVLPSEWATL